MARKKSTTAPAPQTEATAPESTELQYPPDTVLVGRLVADPVLRTTQSGKSVSTIRVADNSGDNPRFVDVVVWNRTAEAVCKFLKKGRLVQVQGRAQERSWTGRDGAERRTDEISAYRVQFLSGQKTASSSPAEKEVA